MTLTVVSSSVDRKALALGPQLAVFAASRGIPTALVSALNRTLTATATLRAACTAPPLPSEPLRVSSRMPRIRRPAGRRSDRRRHRRRRPGSAGHPPDPDAATVLGVSAGVATAEQLARVAASAAVGGHDIIGILVADPDPADTTTGRLPQVDRPAHRRRPTRMTSTNTETARMTDEDTGTPPPRSGARDPNAERRPSAQSRSRSRRTRDSQAQTGEPAAPWQPSFGWFAADDDGAADSSVDFGGDLVNLSFIGAALKRSKPFWVGLAVLGLLIGLASWAMRPPTPSATTTLLLTVGPEAQPGTAILNDQAIAQSRGVATIARQELGLHQSVDSLLASYETTVLTDRVLRITVNAPSTDQAVRRANAITSAFLAFRADQLRAQQRLQFASLDNVLTRSQQHLDSIDARIQQVAAQPASDSRQAQLNALNTTRKQTKSELIVLKEQVNTAKATAEETTAAMIGQSKVLDTASPLSHSQLSLCCCPAPLGSSPAWSWVWASSSSGRSSRIVCAGATTSRERSALRSS